MACFIICDAVIWDLSRSYAITGLKFKRLSVRFFNLQHGNGVPWLLFHRWLNLNTWGSMFSLRTIMVNSALASQTLFVCSLLVLFQITWISANINNICDWTESGLAEIQDLQVVTQLNLRCIRGQIHWSYPTGAIRITFQYYNSGNDFRACFKPSATSSGANIYKQTQNTLTMLVSLRKHVVSLSGDSIETLKSDSSKIYCFQSFGGKATVFLEAIQSYNSVKHVTHINYALEPLASELHTSRQDVCLPCNHTEVVWDFCTGDFVIKARMRLRTLHDDTISEETYFDLSISHVFRQRDNIFTPSKHSKYAGTVVMPSRCHARKNTGHFLMTGNILLGKAHLSCATRYAYARQMAIEMTERGLNECDLSSLINWRLGWGQKLPSGTRACQEQYLSLPLLNMFKDSTYSYNQ